MAIGTPVPFLQLFKYASREDVTLLIIANVLIVYSSLNIPLVNIVYGLMMREMNDFVARRSMFIGPGGGGSADAWSSNSTDFTATTPTTTPPSSTSPSAASADLQEAATFANISHFNGTYHEAQEIFISNSYNLCMIVILFGVSRFIALYLALLFFSQAAANQAKRVKALFFRSLLRQEIAWFERNRTGDFAIRITSDLSKFEDGIGEKIALCLNALFAWVSSLVSSFYYGWELTLVCLVLVPLTIFTTTVIAEFQATYSIRETSALSRAFNVCHEVISSIRTVLSFSGQQKEAERFKSGLDGAYKYGIRRNAFAGLNLGCTWMSGYLGFAICLLYSTKFYTPENYGNYDEAHIITILWSAAGCVFLLNRMMPFIEIIQMARGSASNLFAVIERKSEIDVTSNEGLKPLYFEPNVRFENVYFAYPNGMSEDLSSVAGPEEAGAEREVDDLSMSSPNDGSSAEVQVAGASAKQPANVLIKVDEDSNEADEDQDSDARNTTTTTDSSGVTTQHSSQMSQSDRGTGSPGYTIKNMCMEVKSGQTIALVGPSGSGKSTALALLQRFYEIDDGSIKLGGYNLRDLNLGWLRSQLGVVTQEPVLFDMSIADNIRLGARPGQTVSDSNVEQAARSANAHAFISKLPLGYETRVGTRGVQLSGGQKQRIAIARALVRQPKILLLDEATSALDLESESVVQKALDRARIGRTTFVVAHRLSTVRNADRIFVFDNGTIVESGNHDELIQLRGLYYHINSQQKHGIDLQHAPPPTRRNSLVGQPLVIGAGGLSCGAAGGPSGAGSSAHHLGPGDHYTRESRSLSIYSGKFAATGGFGATGHGGNSEGVENAAGGSCCIEPTGNGITDDDYYYSRKRGDNDDDDGNEADDDDDDDGDDAVIDAYGADLSVDGCTSTQSFKNKIGVGIEETQASLMDGDSVNLITSKGKKVTNLSIWSVLKFIKPHKTYSAIGIVTSLLMGLCIPISALIIGDIATIFATDNPNEIRQGLFSHGLMYTGLAIFAFVISFIQVLSFGVAGEKIGMNLRQRGFQAIMSHELTWFDQKRNSPGSICARLASDVGNVQSITGNRTAVIFQSVSILISTLVFAVYFNLKFSSVCVIFVAILLFSTLLQARFAGKIAKSNRQFDSKIGKIVLESSANIKTLVSLHQEQHFIDRCEQLLLRDSRSISLDNHMRLSLESLKYALTAISKGTSFYFAAGMLLRNEITIDNIFKLIEIILYGLTEASKSLIFISDLEKARRGTQNLYKLIHHMRQQLPITPTGPSAFNCQRRFSNLKCQGKIRFNSVRFHYPSRPESCVLNSFSLEIPPGKSIALVGRSGCGKSTLIQLLEKFYFHSDGQIFIDDYNLHHLPTEWVRRQIALVNQEPSLLSYTIGDNIRYGDNSRQVSYDEMVHAARVANIHEFIMSLPDGYDTQLSESNSLQLSGGQKQRIAIARALVRKAPILVFDEATSALDTESERQVQEALDRAREGKTTIIIAHRLSTIKKADAILVLRDGNIVEKGTHSELMDKRGEYYNLYRKQSR